MNSVIQIFALLAAIVHVFIFFMESIWFMRPRIYTRFGAKSVADAETNRLFAFNQGFYNLFLAIAILVGLSIIQLDGNVVVAQTLILSSGAMMLGAAVVLYFSAGKKMLRSAFIQGIFPMLAWSSWLIL